MRSTATLSLSLATRLISATSRVCPWRTGWFRRGLPRRGPAVAARVGAGEQHAGGGVAADDLDAARAVEVADGPDRMAAACEFAAYRLRKTLLDGQSILAVMRPVGVLAGDIGGPARHLGSLLRIEPEIDHRRQYLQIDLHLVVGAGRAKDAPQCPVLKHDWRVHRMAHPPPGPQPVGMTGLEVPIGHAVVEQDASVAGDNPRTKTAVDALHPRDRIALAVGGAEIGRITRGRGYLLGCVGTPHVDAGGKPCSILWRQQFFERRRDRARIGGPAFAIGKGELFGLDHDMHRVGG